ncbi:putative eukaryotic translation initiation factor 5 [Termitomyces sp. T112]|nr:putative eukaryotic translation initiation factor 5 [Termitomyces sp. T112]
MNVSCLSSSLVAVLVLCIYTSLYLLYNFIQTPRLTYEDKVVLDVESTNSQRRQRVALASTFGFHHDVYMSVAWSLARVMNRMLTGSVEVYANVPFFYDFQKVVDDLGLYQDEYRQIDELSTALRNDLDEKSIDLVILGTCEIDLRDGESSRQLLSIWDERPQNRKFTLVCIVHDVKDTSWQSAITEWSRRRAIRIVTIAEHVAQSFRESFNKLSDSSDPVISSAGYEYIPIDVHVPILPLRNLPERSVSGPLSKAVIQGSFSVDRRDYRNVFHDLNNSLYENASAWGYQALGDHKSFVADNTLSTPPFQLFILGSGNLKVPVELSNVVQVRSDLTYPEYYNLMSQMDICLPAFAEAGQYMHYQASSTFAMALQCDVPILVTTRTRHAYAYADDDRVTVTRPAAMREVAVLKALRLGDASFFLNAPMPLMNTISMGSNQHLKYAVESMLSRGWRRTRKEFDDFKIGIWKRNDDLAYRLIHDL